MKATLRMVRRREGMEVEITTEINLSEIDGEENETLASPVLTLFDVITKLKENKIGGYIEDSWEAVEPEQSPKLSRLQQRRLEAQTK